MKETIQAIINFIGFTLALVLIILAILLLAGAFDADLTQTMVGRLLVEIRRKTL